ncbi:unnamed protein product [Sphacelaria rigidula]
MWVSGCSNVVTGPTYLCLRAALHLQPIRTWRESAWGMYEAQRAGETSVQSHMHIKRWVAGPAWPHTIRVLYNYLDISTANRTCRTSDVNRTMAGTPHFRRLHFGGTLSAVSNHRWQGALSVADWE